MLLLVTDGLLTLLISLYDYNNTSKKVGWRSSYSVECEQRLSYLYVQHKQLGILYIYIDIENFTSS